MPINFPGSIATYADFSEWLASDNTGLDSDQHSRVKSLVEERDFDNADFGECDAWVEFTDRVPGDLEDNAAIVFCVNSGEPGSATAKNYRYI